MSRIGLVLPFGLLLWGCGAPEEASFGTGQPPTAGPPAAVVGGFQIELPPFSLAPGEERQPCYIFPLLVTGPSRIVADAALSTGPGLHHGNITTRKKTGEGFRKCPAMPGDHIAFDILEGGAVLFGSSTQIEGTEWQNFPEGMGYRVREGYEIVARMHYLNATAKPLVVQPRYQWYTIAQASLKPEIGPFAWTYSKFEIPPRSTFTAETECLFSKPMRIVSMLPHMHGLGRRIAAGFVGGPLDGRFFLDDQDYGERGESDIRSYQSAIDLWQDGQGEGVRFLCTWQNHFDKTIFEGVGDNEMCILFGYAYPPENAYSAMALSKDSCLGVTPPPLPGQ